MVVFNIQMFSNETVRGKTHRRTKEQTVTAMCTRLTSYMQNLCLTGTRGDAHKKHSNHRCQHRPKPGIPRRACNIGGKHRRLSPNSPRQPHALTDRLQLARGMHPIDPPITDSTNRSLPCNRSSGPQVLVCAVDFTHPNWLLINLLWILFDTTFRMTAHCNTQFRPYTTRSKSCFVIIRYITCAFVTPPRTYHHHAVEAHR